MRNLALFSGGVIILLIAYAVHLAMPFAQIAPFVPVAVLTSIPVALPSMFTLGLRASFDSWILRQFCR